MLLVDLIPSWGCRAILQEMESVVTRARMFKHKPDGDVTFMKLRDKNGTPVPVFQDPMHYPHGTKFLAPGTSPWACTLPCSIDFCKQPWVNAAVSHFQALPILVFNLYERLRSDTHCPATVQAPWGNVIQCPRILRCAAKCGSTLAII